jgi:hypothetical protein
MWHHDLVVALTIDATRRRPPLHDVSSISRCTFSRKSPANVATPSDFENIFHHLICSSKTGRLYLFSFSASTHIVVGHLSTKFRPYRDVRSHANYRRTSRRLPNLKLFATIYIVARNVTLRFCRPSADARGQSSPTSPRSFVDIVMHVLSQIVGECRDA